MTMELAEAKSVIEMSNADGRYALAVPAGDYALAFSGAGYVRHELAVTVEAGGQKRVDGTMEKAE